MQHKLCECGCGQETPLASQTNRSRGYVKGEPIRFINGHNRRKSPVEYVVDQETGFVVEPGHPPSLERALVSAMADPGRLRQMGAAGRAWYDRRRFEETATLVRMYWQTTAGHKTGIRPRSSEPVIS